MVYRFEEFEFDEKTFRFSRAGQSLTVEPKAIRVLLYLLENTNRLVSKQELLDHVWQESNVSESALTRAIVLLRKALNDDSRVPRFIETVPTLGYRFIANVTVVDASPYTYPVGNPRVQDSTAAARPRSVTFRRPLLVPSLLLLVVIGATGAYFLSHRARPLTEKDTIVLADFTNTTGDPVFDETLRQGLEVQLEQSPFLSLISDERIHQVLALMDQPVGARLTPSIAREVCERTASVAVLEGSIAALGSQYVLGLRAMNCRNGEVIAEEQAQAARKEDVLTALDGTASKLRARLGESLATVEKFDTPLEEATTPSLEALKAFSLGRREVAAGKLNESTPFFQRAVELDPNFAKAYASMSCAVCAGLQEEQAAENARKAYALREKVSQKERLWIEAIYYNTVTGEEEKALSAYELGKQMYPRESRIYTSIGVIYSHLGELERALEENREALRRGPDDVFNYQNVGGNLVSLGRLDEAEAVYKQAEDRHLVLQGHAKSLYLLAFLKGDTARMAQLAASAMGRPGMEDAMLSAEADTEAWYGRLHAADEFTRRAMESAERRGAKETAAGYLAQRSMLEADVGDREQARTDAHAAVKLAPNRDVRAMASLALARDGDFATGEVLAERLSRDFPVDTLTQRYWLPVIRAAAALDRNDAARAAELLEAAHDMELANPAGSLSPGLLAVYVHGYAYLALRDGGHSAEEFQKYVDRRGLVRNSPWGALARLGLARAYAMQGDTAKARTAYQDFLTLWKDADPDIPILKQAKAEYARLEASTSSSTGQR